MTEENAELRGRLQDAQQFAANKQEPSSSSLLDELAYGDSLDVPGRKVSWEDKFGYEATVGGGLSTSTPQQFALKSREEANRALYEKSKLLQLYQVRELLSSYRLIVLLLTSLLLDRIKAISLRGRWRSFASKWRQTEPSQKSSDPGTAQHSTGQGKGEGEGCAIMTAPFCISCCYFMINCG
jgi:hypothetical protein